MLGPSGTGKSTINLLVPDAQAQVGEISEAPTWAATTHIFV